MCNGFVCRFLPLITKLGQGYIFTGVCDSVHRGVCLSACLNTTRARRPPPPGKIEPSWQGDTPPGKADPPARQTTLTRRPLWHGDHPLARTPQARQPPAPLGRQTPLHSACWEIRSTSRRYASYWNAIFVCLCLGQSYPLEDGEYFS